MKKIFTLAILLAAIFPMLKAGDIIPVTAKIISAPVQKLTATNQEIISSTPEGTLIDPLYCSSDASYLVYSGALATMSNNGYAGAMVRTENAVYIRNIISQYEASTYWVKGDVEADGSVTFRFPQLISQNSTDASKNRYVAVMTPHLAGTSVSLKAEEGACDLHMKWEGDRLVQVKPESSDPNLDKFEGIVGLIDNDGDFLGYGEQGISYKTSEIKPLEAPADLQTSRYVYDYVDGSNNAKTTVITVGTSGDDVWFQGLNTFIPEAWVKGSLSNGVVTVPSTFTGIVQGYLTYVTALSEDKTQLVNPLTFTKTDDKYVANATVFVNIGDEKVDLNDNRIYSNVVLTPYVEGNKTPATPVIDTSEEGTEAFIEEEGMGALVFTLDAVDTEGNPLDQSKLYYNVFKNGELYTFDKDLYGLEEDMVDIPYDFQSDLIMSAYGYFFVFFLEDMDSIGVRAVYKDGDTTTYSETATYVFRNAGIVSPEGTSVPVSEEYINLNGQKVNHPENGIYIKITRYADGTMKASKTVVR